MIKAESSGKKVPLFQEIWNLNAVETAVVDALRPGLTNKEIASDLGMGEQEVKRHITKIFRKAMIFDRTALAVAAELLTLAQDGPPEKTGWRLATLLERREAVIIPSILKGLSERVIGEKFGIAVDTVHGRVHGILTKFGADNQTHFASIYVREVLGRALDFRTAFGEPEQNASASDAPVADKTSPLEAWGLAADEMAAARAIRSGASVKGVGAQLHVSNDRAKQMVSGLLDRTGTSNLIELAVAVAKVEPAAAGPVVSRSAAALSPKEMEIIPLVAKGMRNKEIASALLITEQTIKNYVRDMVRRLQVVNRAELAIEYDRTIRPSLAMEAEASASSSSPSADNRGGLLGRLLHKATNYQPSHLIVGAEEPEPPKTVLRSVAGRIVRLPEKAGPILSHPSVLTPSA